MAKVSTEQEISEEEREEIVANWLRLRKRVPGTCIVCSRAFSGYIGKKFCSRACQVKNWRQRQVDKGLVRKGDRFVPA